MAQQPCETCQKYAGGCSWSRDFTPVPGWDATPIEKHGSVVIYSYEIHHCPEYVQDEPRNALERAERDGTEINRLGVCLMAKNGYTASEIARATGLDIRLVRALMEQYREAEQ